MDKHTFIGKRKVGSTEICDFTDYQGIGNNPLYKHYEGVCSIVKKWIDPRYVHFLAAPHYSPDEDTVNWYIDEWNETPERLSDLQEDEKEKYQRIKEDTLAHYKEALKLLSGEELQVMAGAIRYIDDDFIFCCDGKVYAVAWGMTPDTRKHIGKGELVHEAPMVIRQKPVVETRAASVVPPPVPPVPPTPRNAKCRFCAGDNGVLQGNPEVSKIVGSRLSPSDIPQVVAKKGYRFKGWNINPLGVLVGGDITFNALYEKDAPWYKKLWGWLTGKGCLKWLLWIIIGLLLMALLLWLFKGCSGCSRSVPGGVAVPEKIVNLHGDTIDDNGLALPIVGLPDGKLPAGDAVVAPVRDGDGEMAPIEREPGLPPVIANRLFIFLEDDNDDVDAFAADFKKTYPGNQYEIIGYDRDVKSVIIRIPDSERDELRRTMNSRIPNHRFIVFDEEIYELNGHPSSSSTSTPGWHLKAVKAIEGWDITKGNPAITVAVIDDGIDASHPIFKGRIVNPYNVFTQDNRLSKGVGHGTHTAGLAVGSLDFKNQGAAGIAPDCMLMPVQVLDNGVCPLSALISGVMYAVHKGADVVNISLGPSFQGLSDLPLELQNEIARTQFKNMEKLWQRVCKIAADKNTIIVFAAGNDDIISCISPENRSDAAISVGAVDQRLYPTEFTDFGPGTDISAPGKEIYSSFPDSDFRSCDGTSMAAPIVTGAVALMKSIKKDLTVEQARNVLYKTGCDVYGDLPPMVQVNLALEAVERGDFSAPAKRTQRPVPVTGGGDQTVVPPAENESDYESIRRLIEMYKKKISDLERQLPENKR